LQSRLKFVAVVTAGLVCLAGYVTAGAQKKAPPAPGKKPPVVVKKVPAVVQKKTTTTTTTTKKTTTTTTKKLVPAGKVVVPAKNAVTHSAKRHRTRRHRRVRRHRHVRVTVHTTGTYLSGAETSLVGVRLFDSGLKLLQMFGNPDEIQNISGAGGSGGGGGGGPVGGGGGGGGGGGARPGSKFGGGGGGGGGGAGGGRLAERTWAFQDETLFRAQGGQGFGGGGGGTGGGGSDPSAADTSNASGPPYYVRWVYKKEPSQYSFIIDKNNRIVQIEAVGMGDARVRTNRGVTFGTTFEEIIKRYHTPDAYEINGDSLVLRYLTRNKVAFRLNRLVTDKPHVVTAIVVAGGKV
jgi:hypothetical protein